MGFLLQQQQQQHRNKNNKKSPDNNNKAIMNVHHSRASPLQPRSKVSPSEEEERESERLTVNVIVNVNDNNNNNVKKDDSSIKALPVDKPIVIDDPSDSLSESLRVEQLTPVHNNSSKSKDKKSNSSSTTSTFRSITFQNEVSILEFNTIIGDNPGVSSGCPIALGLELSNRTTASLRDLDLKHAQRKKGIREAPKLSFSERAKILHSEGYSVKEIAAATYETIKAKEQRTKTNQKRKWDNIHDWMESVQRKVKKLAL